MCVLGEVCVFRLKFASNEIWTRIDSMIFGWVVWQTTSTNIMFGKLLSSPTLYERCLCLLLLTAYTTSVCLNDLTPNVKPWNDLYAQINDTNTQNNVVPFEPTRLFFVYIFVVSFKKKENSIGAVAAVSLFSISTPEVGFCFWINQQNWCVIEIIFQYIFMSTE